jgi:hypothetical protein
MRKLSESDFLWSVKMRSQLRVLSYEAPFEYRYAVTEEPGYRIYRRIIDCQPGHCILCKPDVDGKGVFWQVKIMDLEQQITNGNLILNSIPAQ